MILVKFSGGLGNQIFQYGLYLELRKRYPDTLVKGDIFTYIYQDVHYGFELDRIFRLTEKGLLELANRKDYYKATGMIAPTKLAPANSFREKLLAFTNARLREKQERLGKRERIQEEPNGLVLTEEIRKERAVVLEKALSVLDPDKDWYIDGYWQSTSYFEHSLDDVIDNLVFPDFEDASNPKWAERIQNTESVSIHVRRGDYTGSIYDVIGMDYYNNAVNDIRDKLQKENKVPSFFIFSDDPDWVKQQFSWLGEYILIDNNKGVDSYRDLQLMSMCKHQITANSSFSIWGGYLNHNRNKRVYYPSRYTQALDNVEKREPGWERIHVE